MLEKALASLLNNLLAEFIEPGNLSQENIQVGVWSGYVVLEQLVLKKSILDLAEAPLSLTHGVVGRFELHIPWNNLGREPVVVVLDQILLLIEPKYEWDDVKSRSTREQAAKQARLATSALFASSRAKVGGRRGGVGAAFADSAYGGYADIMRNYLMDTILRKLVDNFEVHMKSIHIRYEDAVSCPTDFCVGVSIESIDVTTRRDQDGDVTPSDSARTGDGATVAPSFENSPGKEVFKKDINVTNFAVYWNPIIKGSMNPSTSMLLGKSAADIQRLMLRTLVRGNQDSVDRPRHHFLLEPHDIKVQLDVAFHKATLVTQVSTRIHVDRMAICLEDRVLREIITLSANMSSFMNLSQFSIYRPKCTVAENKIAWWNYAINAVLHQVRRRRERFSWKSMRQRRNDKFVYIELWKLKLVGVKGDVKMPQLGLSRGVDTAVLTSSKSGTSSSPELALCYDSLLEVSKCRRAPIENLYQPGDFDVPKGRDASVRAAATSTATSSETPTSSGLGTTLPYYTMDADMRKLMASMEERLCVEDISFFRSLAERDLALEGRSPQTWLVGLSSWLFGGFGASNPADVMTEEDRKKLYDSLHFDPEVIYAGSSSQSRASIDEKAVDRSAVLASVTYDIRELDLSLVLSQPVLYESHAMTNADMVPFLEIDVSGLHAGIVVMGGGAAGTRSVVELSVQEFEAFEVVPLDDAPTLTPQSLAEEQQINLDEIHQQLQYIKLISRKGDEWLRRTALQNALEGKPVKHHSKRRGSVVLNRSAETLPLMRITLEQDNMLKDLVDMTVNIDMEELELFASPTQKLPQFLQTFFTWPADMEFWSEMEMAAVNEISDFQYVLSFKLDYMRRNHMNIEINAEIKAPTLIITETVPWKAKASGSMAKAAMSKGKVTEEVGYLIIDLGHISVRTEKLAKAAYERAIVEHSIVEQSVVSGTEYESPLISERSMRPRPDISAMLRPDDPRISSKKLFDLEPGKSSKMYKTSDLLSEKKLLSTPQSIRNSLKDDSDLSAADNQNVMRGGTNDGSLVDREDAFLHNSFGAMISGTRASGIMSAAESLNQVPGTPTTARSGDVASISKFPSIQAPMSLQSVFKNILQDGINVGETSSVKSNHSSARRQNVTDEPSIAEDTNSVANDKVSKQDNLFDIFRVNVSNCSVYMIESLQQLSEPMSEEAFLQCCIVDRYDISMEIHVSVLQWDKDLPQAKLDIEMPSIRLLLSDSKLKRLSGIIDAVSASSNKIITAHQEALAKIELAKQRRLSNDLSLPSMRSFRKARSGTYDKDSWGSDERSHVSSDERIRSSPPRTGRAMPGLVTASPSDENEDNMEFFDANTDIVEGSPTESVRNGISGGLSLEKLRFIEKLRSNRSAPSDIFSSDGVTGDAANGSNELDDIDADYVSDAESDDSFVSAREHELTLEEASEEAERLSQLLKQRQFMKARVMEDIRLIESDSSRQNAIRLASLQEDLRQLEGEVQQLRVSYVEALLSVDELKRGADTSAGIDDSPDRSRDFNSAATPSGSSSLRDVLESLSNQSSGPKERYLVDKRTLLKNSVFRPLPETHRRRLVGGRGGVGGNKEIIRFSMYISSILIDMECIPLELHEDEKANSAQFKASNSFRNADQSPMSQAGGTEASNTPASGQSNTETSPPFATPFSTGQGSERGNISSGWDHRKPRTQFSPKSPKAYASFQKAVIRQRVSGVNITAKVRADDFKGNFTVQHIAVDIIEHDSLSRPGSEVLSLINTEAPFYSTAVHRPNSQRIPDHNDEDLNQFLKAEIKVIYGKEIPMDSQGGKFSSSRKFSAFARADDPLTTKMKPTTSKINVSFGYVGLNVDQHALVYVLSTAIGLNDIFQSSKAIQGNQRPNQIQNDIPVVSAKVAKDENAYVPSVTASPVDGKRSGVSWGDGVKQGDAETPDANFSPYDSAVVTKLSFRSYGISVSYVHRGRTILTGSVWGLSANARQLGDNRLSLKSRIADINAYYLRYDNNVDVNKHLVVSSANTAIFYKELLFGRPSDSSDASLDLELSLTPSCKGDNKFKLKCELDVSAVELNIVPKVVLKLISVVQSGPLLSFIGKVSKSSGSVSQADPAKQGPVFGPALNGLRAVCAGVGGTVQINAKGTAVHLISSFEEVERKLGLTFRVGGVACFLSFGSDSAFGGVDSYLSIIGITASIAERSLLAPFDISSQLVALYGPDEDIPVKSKSSPERVSAVASYFVPDRRSSLLLSPWKTTPIYSISHNQIQISVSISPIKFEVHEAVLYSSKLFIEKIMPHVTPYVSSGSFEVRNDTEVSSMPYPWETDWGVDISVAAVLYEVQISLDSMGNQESGAAPKAQQRDKARTPKNVRGKTHRGSKHEDHNRLSIFSGAKKQSVLGIFTRDIRFDISFNGNRQVQQSRSANFVSVCTKIRSFDIFHHRARSESMCRLVATVDGRRHASSHSFGFSQSRDERDSDSFFTSHLFLSTNADVEIESRISRVQLVTLSECIIAVAALGALYKTACVDSLRDLDAIRKALPCLYSDSDPNFAKQKRWRDASAATNEQVSDSMLHSQLPTAETGVLAAAPKAASDDTGDGTTLSAMDMPEADDSSPNKVSSNEPSSNIPLFTRQSFSLPAGLRSFKVLLCSRSCGLFMPGSDVDASALGFSASADVDAIFQFHPPDIRRPSQSFEPMSPDENADTLFSSYGSPRNLASLWTTDITVTNIEARLQGMKHEEVFKPLAELSVYGDEEPCTTSRPSPESSDRVIVAPCTVNVLHAISLHEFDKGSCVRVDGVPALVSVPKLLQKLNITIHELNAYVCMDYRPLFAIYANCIEPLFDITKIVGSLKGDSKRSRDSTRATSAPPKQANEIIKPKVVNIQNSLQLFQLLPSLAGCEVNVRVDSLKVMVVNDIYREPITIFRFLLQDIVTNCKLDLVSVAAISTRSDGAVDDHLSEIERALVFEDKMRSTASDISFVLDAKAGLEYHNHTLTAWEPLLEPFGIFLKASAPLSLVIGQNIESLHGDAVNVIWDLAEYLHATSDSSRLSYDVVRDIFSKLAPHSDYNMDSEVILMSNHAEISLSISTVMNLNITSGFLETVQGAVDEFTRLAAGFNRTLSVRSDMRPKYLIENSKGEKEMSLVTIKNGTGMELKFWQSGFKPRASVISSNQNAPLSLDRSEATSNGLAHRAINISLLPSSKSPIEHRGQTWHSIRDLPLDGDGSRIFLVDLGVATHTEGADTAKNAKSHHRPRMADFGNPDAVCLVTELVSSKGSKVLVVRSTLYVFNSLGIAISIKLVARESASDSPNILWETVVPSNNGAAVPAIYCNHSTAEFLIAPVESSAPHATDGKSSFVASPVSMPHIPNIDPQKDQAMLKSALASGKLRYLVDRAKHAPDVVSYAHWLEFDRNVKEDQSNLLISDASRVNAIASIVSTGSPDRYHSKYSETHMSRVITILPPVLITNCLAYSIEIAVGRSLTEEAVVSKSRSLSGGAAACGTLNPGDTLNTLAFGARDTLIFQLRLKSPSAGVSSWSDRVFIPKCAFEGIGDKSTYPAEVVFENGSSLFVSVEVVDRHGSRDISVFVPFWVIAASHFPLQFQHDPINATERRLNGADDLCADQFYYDEKLIQAMTKVSDGPSVSQPYSLWSEVKSAIFGPPSLTRADSGNQAIERMMMGQKNVTGTPSKQTSTKSQVDAVAAHVAAVRGADGIILGPEAPSRGLHDFMKSSAGQKSVKRVLTQVSSQGANAFQSGELGEGMNSISEQLQSGSNLFENELSFKLMHFSFKDKSLQSRLRLRVVGSSWSSTVNLARVGPTHLEVTTDKTWYGSLVRWARDLRVASRDAPYNPSGFDAHQSIQDKSRSDTNGVQSVSSLETAMSKVVNRNYTFGLMTAPAEYPFHRTMLVIVADEYVVVNNINQSLEIRQYGSSHVEPVRPAGSVSLSWYSDGPRLLQVRLARYGWNWSGRFDPTVEGQTSLRLRNEHDSTVFFVMVYVVKRGPRMFIALRGGEKVATYRIENHTLETLKLHQVNVPVVTTLLPYHSCMYSWDDPLSPQKLTLESMRQNQRQAWMNIGQYSFNRLTTYPAVDHLIIRVIARGPLRVMQIYDKRTFIHEDQMLSNVMQSAMLNHKAAEFVRQIKLRLALNIAAIGISVIDRTPQELLYFSVTNVRLHHDMLPNKDSLTIDIGQIRIDNQLLSTSFPSLFSPVINPSNQLTYDDRNHHPEQQLALQEHNRGSFITVELHRDFSYPDIHFFPLIRISIAPFDVNMESAIISKLVMSMSTLIQESAQVEKPHAVHPVLAQNSCTVNGRRRITHNYAPCLLSPSVRMQFQSESEASARCLSQLRDDGISHPHGGMHCLNTASKSLVSMINSVCRPSHLVNTDITVSSMAQRALRSISPPPEEILISTSKLYIEKLDMSAIRMNISFNPGLLRAGEDVISEEEHLVMWIVGGVLRGLGSTMAKIDNVPLNFYRIELEHVFGGPESVYKALAEKYSLQAILQAFVVLFSLEVFGNPVQLFVNMWEGISDFVSFPISGLIQSPAEFVRGIRKGTQSLLLRFASSIVKTLNRVAITSQTTMLVLNTVTVISGYGSTTTPKYPTDTSAPLSTSVDGSIQASPGQPIGVVSDIGPVVETSSSLAGPLELAAAAAKRLATMNKGSFGSSDALAEIDERSIRVLRSDSLADVRTAIISSTTTNARPGNLAGKMLLPSNLFEGISQGLSGLLYYPYYGFQARGMWGLIFGMSRGFMEVLSKPIYGFFGSLSNITSDLYLRIGTRLNVGNKRRLQRVRAPRVFTDPSMPLKPYVAHEHVSYELLHRIQNGLYLDEGYLYHSTLPSWSITVLTAKRLLVVGGSPTDYCEMHWMCPLTQIVHIETNKIDNVVGPRASYAASGESAIINLYYLPGAANQQNPEMVYREDDLTANGLTIQTLRFYNTRQSSEFLTHLLKARPSLRTDAIVKYLNKSQEAIRKLKRAKSKALQHHR